MFAKVMDKLTNEVRQEFPVDPDVCEDEQVEYSQKWWRYVGLQEQKATLVKIITTIL